MYSPSDRRVCGPTRCRMARGRFPSVGAKEGGATWKSGDRHRWLFEAGGKGGGKGRAMVAAGRPQAPGANLEKGPRSPAPGEGGFACSTTGRARDPRLSSSREMLQAANRSARLVSKQPKSRANKGVNTRGRARPEASWVQVGPEDARSWDRVFINQPQAYSKAHSVPSGPLVDGVHVVVARGNGMAAEPGGLVCVQRWMHKGRFSAKEPARRAASGEPTAGSHWEPLVGGFPGAPEPCAPKLRHPTPKPETHHVAAGQ